MQIETLNINLEDVNPTLEDIGPDEYNVHSKLFISDSETSINSEVPSATTANNKAKSDKLDYSNYSKLFEKKPFKESLSSRNSTSFILEDYNSFKHKLSMKKSLHK
jgi:hypothetical protein